MKKPLVLIIEDNPLNLELETDLLEVAGCTVHAAASAETAVQEVAEQQPDVVLMDLSLPGVDGLEAIRALKANPRTRAVPVVVVTSNALKGDQLAAEQAGCDAYLTKPINTRTFAPTILSFAMQPYTTQETLK